MIIACICSTKNEGDIIEAFVRLNARICNSFFFIDESSDNTREIIALLVKEGYDLNYLPKSEGGYNQPNPTKAYLSRVKRTINPDWIFLLDADEIIVAPDKEKLLQEIQNIQPNTYLAAEWKTYVPTTLNYFDSTSPLSECFRLRKDKREIFKKVSIPGRIVDNIITTTGNHSAKSLNGTTIREQSAKSYHLAHFPVRSAEQIIVKNLIATHMLTSRVDRAKGEGFHVFPIFHMIRNRNYTLTIDDLTNIAIDYSCSESPKSCISDELDLEDNLELKTELLYLNLGRINVVARLDSEIERLSMEIRRKKEGVISTKAKLGAFYLQVHDDR
ncbi:MAG: glycosyltransferase family 2 protein [Syntrophorhabdales bacterium]|jgi:hypothetical protein